MPRMSGARFLAETLAGYGVPWPKRDRATQSTIATSRH